jgi:hypothetical protein
MTDNTIEQQLADLRKEVAQILANQQSLEGLLKIIGRQIHMKEGTSPAHFESLAETWTVKGSPRA